jgi:hypothetical protein
LVLCTAVAVSILAGCGAATPSAAPTASTAPAPTQSPQSSTGTIGGTVTYQWEGAPATTVVDIRADGATVSGTAETTLATGTHSVKVECAAREGESWALAGTVEKSTADAASVGGWSAVIVKDGSPQKIGIWMSDPKTAGSPCAAWLAGTGFATLDPARFEPVTSGTLASPPNAAS